MSKPIGTTRAVLVERRRRLETDLNELAAAVEGEHTKALERQEAIKAARECIASTSEDASETLREDWYLAVYQDAQHEAVVAHPLVERYGQVASQLLECQQELTQLARVHRRGVPHSGA